MDENEIYKQLGALVKKYRWERLKMTQRELADKIGLSRASIANIESGNQRILLHQLYLLAENLEIDIQELLPKPQATTDTLDLKEKMPPHTSKKDKDWVGNIMRRRNQYGHVTDKKKSKESNS